MTTESLRQPKVFYLAFFTSMCERFGFYVLSFLLVLFTKSVFKLGDTEAFTLFAVFTSFAFITPVIGGYLADNFFGIRRSIILGLFLEALGLTALSLPHNNLFMLGLSLVVIGVGFFKTGPTNLLARSYKAKDPRIDSGFTLFYMGINIGSFLAPLLAGFVQRYYGWHVAFLMGAIVIYTGLIWYFLLRTSAKRVDSIPGRHKFSHKNMLQIMIGLVLTCVAFTFLIAHAKIAYGFFFLSTASLLVYFFYEIVKSSARDKLRIIACLLLIVMGMVFFILYFQLYTSVDLFIDRCVTHQILNINIPTVGFLSLNGLWILILSPILAFVYSQLGKRGLDLTVTTKFPIGILIISLCFFSLAYSIQFANAAGKVAPGWIVLALGLYSLGELLISALGVAMVTHVSPKRLYGIMMGTWYLASSLAASLSSLIATYSSIPKRLHDPFVILHIYKDTFIKVGGIGAIAAAVAFAVSPYIKHIARLDR